MVYDNGLQSDLFCDITFGTLEIHRYTDKAHFNFSVNHIHMIYRRTSAIQYSMLLLLENWCNLTAISIIIFVVYLLFGWLSPLLIMPNISRYFFFNSSFYCLSPFWIIVLFRSPIILSDFYLLNSDSNQRIQWFYNRFHWVIHLHVCATDLYDIRHFHILFCNTNAFVYLYLFHYHIPMNSYQCGDSLKRSRWEKDKKIKRGGQEPIGT